jgi:hypothetical protein
LALSLVAGAAQADVVLVPGTVNGTVSFGNWPFTSGNVQISGAGDANGSYGSTSFNGSTFALVLPGGLTYKSQYISMYKYDNATATQQQATFYPNIDVAVPSGGSVDVTFQRDAGFIAPVVNLTGGAIAGSQFSANVNVANNYAYGSASGSSATLPKIPMVAAADINLYQARVTVDVADPANPSAVLCRTDVLLPTKTVTVAANTDTVVSYDLTVGVQLRLRVRLRPELHQQADHFERHDLQDRRSGGGQLVPGRRHVLQQLQELPAVPQPEPALYHLDRRFRHGHAGLHL